MPGTIEPEVSIIIPAYNEARRHSQSLEAPVDHFGFSAWASRSYEVLIVVEHSTDGTLDLAREATAEQANFHVIDNRAPRGKGYAVRSGRRGEPSYFSPLVLVFGSFCSN